MRESQVDLLGRVLAHVVLPDDAEAEVVLLRWMEVLTPSYSSARHLIHTF